MYWHLSINLILNYNIMWTVYNNLNNHYVKSVYQKFDSLCNIDIYKETMHNYLIVLSLKS